LRNRNGDGDVLLDEQANIRKEKNFFEIRVAEYQTGGLNWDQLTIC